MKNKGISDTEKDQDVSLLAKSKEKKAEDAKNSMVLLEDALTHCKFGRFNIRLLLATIFGVFASTMVTTTSSYILSSAECDLGMTNVQKGVLNAVPFVGKEKKAEDAKNSMVLLEDALTHCKFGRFNIRLLLATIFGVFASTMVTTTSSYILSSAECDLGMTNVQKGVLNAVPFVGQVGAAMFTGFCTDAFGRKMFLVGGNLGILICALFEGLSQNYWMLLFGKMIEGIFLSFSTSGTTTMVSEMTPRHIRDKAVLISAACMSVSLIVTALMSWVILPQPWHFVISPYFELHSWNMYLIICSIWSLLAAVMYYYLPESPKWLLTHGQEDAALKILKDMYVENTGKDADSFPFKTLKTPGAAPTVSSKDTSLRRKIINGLKDSKYLFKRPIVWSLITFSGITFVCLFAYSALRLWFPQLSTMIESYLKNHETPADFCTMLTNYNEQPDVTTPMMLAEESLLVRNISEPEVCVPHLSGSQTYINNIIMGAISLSCFLLSTYMIDHIGHKILIFISFIMCALCSGSLYWTNSSIQIAILVSFACAFVQNALMLQQVILVSVFPTTLRSLAFSMILMTGRIGSLVGNIVFPVLLEAGCMAPFLLLAIICLLIDNIVYFLPGVAKEGEGK